MHCVRKGLIENGRLYAYVVVFEISGFILERTLADIQQMDVPDKCLFVHKTTYLIQQSQKRSFSNGHVQMQCRKRA